MLATRQVLGRRSCAGRVEGAVEGINRLQSAEHRGTYSVLRPLGVCSVSPIAHNMLLRCPLAFWGLLGK